MTHGNTRLGGSTRSGTPRRERVENIQAWWHKEPSSKVRWPALHAIWFAQDCREIQNQHTSLEEIITALKGVYWLLWGLGGYPHGVCSRIPHGNSTPIPSSTIMNPYSSTSARAGARGLLSRIRGYPIGYPKGNKGPTCSNRRTKRSIRSFRAGPGAGLDTPTKCIPVTTSPRHTRNAANAPIDISLDDGK